MINLKHEVPTDFLKEEVRCGYEVTVLRKEMWAIELDLLAELDSICRKHKLHYCVGAGTLLGAVRHKGFIPWDNDIDIFMLRPDYDKLMNLANEFKKPYFLQNSYTEHSNFKSHAKLRNSDTTGYALFEKNYNINKGIFIDIFPLDGVSNSIKTDEKQKVLNDKYLYLLKKYNYVVSNEKETNTFDKIVRVLYKIFFSVVRKNLLFYLYDSNLKRCSAKSTKIWGNRTLVFECPKSRRPLNDYRNLKRVPFEFLMVPIPRNYDEILHQQYGNYMKIPGNKNGSRHGKIIVSTDKSYLEKQRKERML